MTLEVTDPSVCARCLRPIGVDGCKKTLRLSAQDDWMAIECMNRTIARLESELKAARSTQQVPTPRPFMVADVTAAVEVMNAANPRHADGFYTPGERVDIASALAPEVSERSRHFERHTGNWYEWSTDISNRDQAGKLLGAPERLFVRSQDCGIEIVESKVTSSAPGAREFENGRSAVIFLTDDIAEWLRCALGKALAVDTGSETVNGEPQEAQS